MSMPAYPGTGGRTSSPSESGARDVLMALGRHVAAFAGFEVCATPFQVDGTPTLRVRAPRDSTRGADGACRSASGRSGSEEIHLAVVPEGANACSGFCRCLLRNGFRAVLLPPHVDAGIHRVRLSGTDECLEARLIAAATESFLWRRAGGIEPFGNQPDEATRHAIGIVRAARLFSRVLPGNQRTVSAGLAHADQLHLEVVGCRDLGIERKLRHLADRDHPTGMLLMPSRSSLRLEDHLDARGISIDHGRRIAPLPASSTRYPIDDETGGFSTITILSPSGSRWGMAVDTADATVRMEAWFDPDIQETSASMRVDRADADGHGGRARVRVAARSIFCPIFAYVWSRLLEALSMPLLRHELLRADSARSVLSLLSYEVDPVASGSERTSPSWPWKPWAWWRR